MENRPKNRYFVRTIVDSIKNLVARKNSNMQKSNPKKAGLKIKLGKIQNGYILESDYKQLNSLFVPGLPMFGYDYDLLSHIELRGVKLDSGHEINIEGILPVVKLSQTKTEEGKTIKKIHIKGRISRKCSLLPRVSSGSFMKGTRLRKNGTLFRPPVTISELRKKSIELEKEEKRVNVQSSQTSQPNVYERMQNSPKMVGRGTSMNLKTVQIVADQYNEDEERRERFRKKRRPTGFPLLSNIPSFSTLEENNVSKQTEKEEPWDIKIQTSDQYNEEDEMKKNLKEKSELPPIDFNGEKPNANDEHRQVEKRTTVDINRVPSRKYDDEMRKRVKTKKRTEDSKKTDHQNLTVGNESKSDMMKKTQSHGYFNERNNCNISHDRMKESSNLKNTEMIESSKSSHCSINSYSEYETVNSTDSYIENLLFFNNKPQQKEKEEKVEYSLIGKRNAVVNSSQNITEISPPPNSITITRSKKRYITLSNGEELVEKPGDEIVIVDTSNGDREIMIKENSSKVLNNVFTSDDYFNESDIKLDKQMSWLEKLIK